MDIALSPYEFSPQSPACAAALMVSQRVVTVLPIRPGADVNEGTREEAALERLLKHWVWAAPLFGAGIVSGGDRETPPIDQVLRTAGVMASRDDLAALRMLVRTAAGELADSLAAHIVKDIEKGGTDPGVCIAVNSGLDRYAAAQRVPVMWQAMPSVMGKLQARLSKPALRLNIPVLVGATGMQHLEARDLLEREREEVRDALAAALDELKDELENTEIQGDSAHRPAAASTDALGAACDQLLAAAREHAPILTQREEDQTRPPKLAMVSVGVSLNDADEGLKHAAAATACALPELARKATARARTSSATEPSQTLAPADTGTVMRLKVRPMPWDV